MLAVFIFIFVVLFSAFFFYTDGSYQLSFKSKFYYSISNYKESYELASKAAKLDWKNKMAASLLVKSEIALKYEDYIQQGMDYIQSIGKMSQAGISNEDKGRINLMCDIMIEQFDAIVGKAHAPEDLLLKATQIRDNFKRVKSELF